MRLVKVLFALAVLTALVGTGTASATPHELIGLCKANELLLCVTGNIVKVGSGQLLGKATNPVFEGTLSETCESSSSTAKVTGAEDKKTPLDGEVTALTFTGCKPCTSVTLQGGPDVFHLLLLAVAPTWLWHFLLLVIRFTGCPFGATCTFNSESAESLIEMTETQAVLNTNKVKLSFKEGTKFVCGESANWNAKYALRWSLSGGGEESVYPTALGEA